MKLIALDAQTSMKHFIQFHSQTVLIDCEVLAVDRYILDIFADLLTDTSHFKTIANYRVEKSNNQIIVSANKELIFKHTSPIETAYFMMNQAKFDMIENINDALVLHAALVSNGQLSKQQMSILMPGNSGRGKSLLTLGLLSLGFEYHTDEVITVDQNTQQIRSFIRPLMIKSHGIKPVKTLLTMLDKSCTDYFIKGENMFSLPTQKIQHLFSDDSSLQNTTSPKQSPSNISHIIFPRWANDSSARLEAVSPAQAAMELFKNNIAGRNLSQLGMPMIKHLCEQAKAYELHYSDFSQLHGLISKLN